MLMLKLYLFEDTMSNWDAEVHLKQVFNFFDFKKKCTVLMNSFW